MSYLIRLDLHTLGLRARMRTFSLQRVLQSEDLAISLISKVNVTGWIAGGTNCKLNLLVLESKVMISQPSLSTCPKFAVGSTQWAIAVSASFAREVGGTWVQLEVPYHRQSTKGISYHWQEL